MSAELLGAKMLAPYFGSSLYVWSAIFAITLGGLAIGYFAGGIISYRSKNPNVLFYILLIAATFTVLMPFTSNFVMLRLGAISLISSIIISSILFLFPPMFFMGMCSPLIIRKISRHIEESGKVAGAVYAVSTTGGIIAAFVMGFYVIPNFGLTFPAIICGFALGIIPLTILVTDKKFFSLVFFLIFAWAINSASTLSFYNSDIKLLHTSEGMLGQLMITDYPLYDVATHKVKSHTRYLFVNRIPQTRMRLDSSENKYFAYVNMIAHCAENYPEGSRALILGLGGGSIANELIASGFKVDVCELDERIHALAKKYFFLNEKVNVTIDDARHFINSKLLTPHSQLNYDLIVFDVFKGEETPGHVFTKECLEAVKQLLKKDGMIAVNGNGYWDEEAGRGMRSVCKTFMSAGFKVDVVPTEKKEELRNIEFFASLNGRHTNFIRHLPKLQTEDLVDAEVLSDEKPRLEILNAEANRKWRLACIKYFQHEYYSGRALPLF